MRAALVACLCVSALAGAHPVAASGQVGPEASPAASAASATIVSREGPLGATRHAVGAGGPLTAPTTRRPEDAVFAYLRAHRDRFGLDGRQLADLDLVERSTSPDGVHHLGWIRRVDGVAVVGSGVRAHVDDRGRVLVVEAATPDGGADQVPPARLDSHAALARARAAVGAPAHPSRVRSDGGARAATVFVGDERAEPVVVRRSGGLRPGWQVEVLDAAGGRHSIVVDGRDGRVMHRAPISSSALAHVTPLAPGAPLGGTPTAHQIDPPGGGWLTDHAAATRLAGNHAHVYADTDGDNVAGPGEDVASSGGGHWLFARQPFPPSSGARPCPVGGCSWDPAAPASAATNRSQAGANLFFHVNIFHDHLRDSAVGFTAAAGAFEGTERLIVEFDDPGGRNNARMTTPPRGRAPRLELYRWDDPAVSPADDATVIYHEYAHGVVARMAGGPTAAVGLSGPHGDAMSEGFSDWLAVDFLAGRGLMHDDPARPGDIVVGGHVDPPYGVRRQAVDCRVADIDPVRCPGAPGQPPGGLTFADVARLTEEHDRGEFWSQTLWDLRTAIVAQGGDLDEVRGIVVGGLRMAPAGAHMVQMRDAMLAHVVAVRPDRYRLVWEVFAARGLGAGAWVGAESGSALGESFAMPQGLWMGDVWVDENPEAGGDGDGMMRPGETFAIRPELVNAGLAPTGEVEGRLVSDTPGVTIRAGSAYWPSLASPWGRSQPLSDLQITAPERCVPQELELRLLVSGSGISQSLPFAIPVRPRRLHDGAPGPGAATTTQIPVGGGPAIAQEFSSGLTGQVPYVRVRIDDLTHPRIADLVVRLEHVPSGIGVVLLDRPATPRSDLRNVIFDDLADNPITVGGHTPGHTGVWQPHQSLAPLYGVDAAGPWRLVVRDTGTGAAGFLAGWGISTAAPDCSPAGVNPVAPAGVDPALPQAAPPPVQLEADPVPDLVLRVAPRVTPSPVVRFGPTARRLVLPARRATRLRVAVAASTRVSYRVRVTVPAHRDARGRRVLARRVLLTSGRARATAAGIAVLPVAPSTTARRRLPASRKTFVAHLEVAAPGGRVFIRRFILIPQPRS